MRTRSLRVRVEGEDQRYEGEDQRYEGEDQRCEGEDQRYEGEDQRCEGEDQRCEVHWAVSVNRLAHLSIASDIITGVLVCTHVLHTQSLKERVNEGGRGKEERGLDLHFWHPTLRWSCLVSS